MPLYLLELSQDVATNAKIPSFLMPLFHAVQNQYIFGAAGVCLVAVLLLGWAYRRLDQRQTKNTEN